MKKPIILVGIIISAIILAIIFSISGTQTSTKTEESQNPVKEINVDVFMPTKSSRPGCEETNSCYIPSKIIASVNEEIVWINEDAAFHSVTSGTYEEPDGLFDSGHLDPNQSFTFTFEIEGDYDYFCTLHPWMKGTVYVES